MVGLIVFGTFFLCSLCYYLPQSLEKSKLKRQTLENTNKPPDIPFYVKDELEGLDRQIDANYHLLNGINWKIESEHDSYKRAKLETQAAALMVKIAKIERKAYNIREQYNL